MTLTGKKLIVEVSTFHSVIELKELIFDKEGIPPEQQRLSFEGRELKDDQSIQDYPITQQSKLYLGILLRGGPEEFYFSATELFTNKQHTFKSNDS